MTGYANQMAADTPRAMSEADLQALVVDLAMWSGWRVHHCRPARTRSGGWSTPITGHSGFPDLVLVHPHRGVLWVELKSQTGRLSDAQQAWREAIEAAGGDYRLWRPSDVDAIKAAVTS